MHRWVHPRNTKTKIESVGTNIGNTDRTTGLVHGPKDVVMVTVISQERNVRTGNVREKSSIRETSSMNNLPRIRS